MTRLLATQDVAVLAHAGIDILISHGSFLVAESCGLKSLEETEIAHHCRNNLVLWELADRVHVAAADVHDQVAVDDVALVVHSDTAICVSVEGKAAVKEVAPDMVLQSRNMG